jgi:hypothetical protein
MTRACGIAAVLIAAASAARAEDPPPAAKPAVHENKISADAKAAMDAYAKLVYRPTDRGLRSLSGTIVAESSKTPKTSTFEFTAPAAVSVSTSGDAKPDSPAVNAEAAFHRFALITALDGVRIGGSTELDAAFVEKDGARWLQVVEYRAGARTATVEYALDARGLVTSLRRRTGSDAAKPVSDTTIRLTWGACGKLFRVESADLVSGPPDTTTFGHYELRYGTVDGFSVPTSYVRTHVEAGKDAKPYPYRFDDLVVNGKKAAAPKPGADPPGDAGKK